MYLQGGFNYEDQPDIEQGRRIISLAAVWRSDLSGRVVRRPLTRGMFTSPLFFIVKKIYDDIINI